MYDKIIGLCAAGLTVRDADSRKVKNKAVYAALGVSRDGVRELPDTQSS